MGAKNIGINKMIREYKNPKPKKVVENEEENNNTIEEPIAESEKVVENEEEKNNTIEEPIAESEKVVENEENNKTEEESIIGENNNNTEEEKMIDPVDNKVADVLESVIEKNKTDFKFYSKENLFLGENNKDLSDLKESDRLKQSIQDYEVANNFYSIIDNLKTVNLQELVNKVDFREKIKTIASRLGLVEADILEVLKNHEDNITAIAQKEVLKAERDSKKKIKIGKTELAWSDLARVGAYTTGAIAGSAFFGIGGTIGVATIRIVEKYLKGKSEEKKIKAKVGEIKNNIDNDKVWQELSAATFIKGTEKWNKDFFAMDEAGQETILNSYVDLKYPGCNKKRREQLLSIYKTELNLEKNQIDKETAFLKKNSSLLTKAKNLLSGTNISNQDRVINSAIVTGAIVGLRLGSKEIPILKNVLGAYVGWNMGALAGKAIFKENKDQLDLNQGEKISEQIKIIKEKYQILKEVDEKYQTERNKKNNQANQTIRQEEIKTQEREIDRELDGLKLLNARALILLDDLSFKKNNPEKYLQLQEEVAQSKSYLRFLEFKFKAKELNDLKEEKMMNNRKEDRDKNILKYLLKISSAALGFITPEIINSISDNISHNHDSDFKNIKIEESNSSQNIDTIKPSANTVEQNTDISLENKVDLAEVKAENYVSNPEVNTVINEAIGENQKTIILEPGDGISKIFDGHMGNNEKITFVNAENGESFVGSANSIVVHPGDKVILGADGNINVILNHGVQANILEDIPAVTNLPSAEVDSVINEVNPDNLNIEDQNKQSLEEALASDGTNLDDYYKSSETESNVLSDYENEQAFKQALASEGIDLDKYNSSISPVNSEIDISDDSEYSPDNLHNMMEVENNDGSNNISNAIEQPNNSYDPVTDVNQSSNGILKNDNIESHNNIVEHNDEVKSETINDSPVVENNNEYKIKVAFKNSDSLKESLGDYGKRFEITEHRKVIGPDLFTLKDTDTGKEFGMSFPDKNSVKIEEIDDLKKFLAGESNNEQSTIIHDKFSAQDLKTSINILSKDK